MFKAGDKVFHTGHKKVFTLRGKSGVSYLGNPVWSVEENPDGYSETNLRPVSDSPASEDRLNHGALEREAAPAIVTRSHTGELVKLPYANRSDSTLVQILTEKDAEIAAMKAEQVKWCALRDGVQDELTRQLKEAMDALGKEKAALNQTLKKYAELQADFKHLRNQARALERM